MSSAAHRLRLQIEAALADRIPSALTPAPRVPHPAATTGVAALDEKLGGGIPLGALTELAGMECSGRTSLALSFVGGLTQAGRVCAWVDVTDALDPESAAAIGVDLSRLLWVRCGSEAPRQAPLPGLLSSPGNLLGIKKKADVPHVLHEENSSVWEPRCAEPQPRRIPASRQKREAATCSLPRRHPEEKRVAQQPLIIGEKPWSRLDQALRVTDLLLQAGGFSAIVLDMGSVAPEFVLRVPLAAWFRYRAAAERTQAAFLLLSQQTCAKSSAAVVLHFSAGKRADEGVSVLTGAEYEITIARERQGGGAEGFRKPPQSACRGVGEAAGGRPESSSGFSQSVRWQTHAAWDSVCSDRAKAGCQ